MNQSYEMKKDKILAPFFLPVVCFVLFFEEEQYCHLSWNREQEAKTIHKENHTVET